MPVCARRVAVGKVDEDRKSGREREKWSGVIMRRGDGDEIPGNEKFSFSPARKRRLFIFISENSEREREREREQCNEREKEKRKRDVLIENLDTRLDE